MRSQTINEVGNCANGQSITGVGEASIDNYLSYTVIVTLILMQNDYKVTVATIMPRTEQPAAIYIPRAPSRRAIAVG